MEIETFKGILRTFVDDPTDIQMDKREMLMDIRGELISIMLKLTGNSLTVIEDNVSSPAIKWITDRISKLSLLAQRIIDYIPEEKYFISPKGKMDEEECKNNDCISDVMSCLKSKMDETSALSTNVVYITSDAGEGKTTLINRLAREKAQEFKEKKSSWLLIPISLGGKPFIRLDDLTIAAFMNRFRFPHLYYDSIIELVKLGVVVPAFDGFEEMFMESSTGEALSAMGQFIKRLDSKGSVIIAARKAFFDYKNFTSQAKFFDTIETQNVNFARIALDRWDKDQFIEYAKLRQVDNPEHIYDVISTTHPQDHSILTRAVLVKQLMELISGQKDVETFIRSLSSGASQFYFENLVLAIIEREANEKWIDRSGEPFKALISVEDHLILLSNIAFEMWINNTDCLNDEIIDYIVDIFSEQKHYSPHIHRQVRERIKQHALLIRQDSVYNGFSFDHEEFRQYFLGIIISNKVIEQDTLDLITALSVSALPLQTVDTIAESLKKHSFKIKTFQNFLRSLIVDDSPISYLRENLGSIIIRFISEDHEGKIQLNGLMFPIDSLRGKIIRNAEFSDCYFQSTSFDYTTLENCVFKKCTFDKIEFYESSVLSLNKMDQCTVKSIYENKNSVTHYDPKIIDVILLRYSFNNVENQIVDETPEDSYTPDEKYILTEKFIKAFLKTTRLADNILKTKFGTRYSFFINEVLPDLEHYEIVQKIVQANTSYKLLIPMRKIDEIFMESNGQFAIMLEKLSKSH